MYGKVTGYKEAKGLYDRTKGRAILRYHGINRYSVLDGRAMDAQVRAWYPTRPRHAA